MYLRIDNALDKETREVYGMIGLVGDE